MVGPGGSALRLKVTTRLTELAEIEMAPAVAPAVTLTVATPWLLVRADTADREAEPLWTEKAT